MRAEVGHNTMAFRSGLRLALTSSKLGFRLVQQQGLPLNGHNYIPALQVQSCGHES